MLASNGMEDGCVFCRLIGVPVSKSVCIALLPHTTVGNNGAKQLDGWEMKVKTDRHALKPMRGQAVHLAFDSFFNSFPFSFFEEDRHLSQR